MSMTERDFEIVEGWLREAMEYGEERHNEPYEKAIHALEEIQQYRAIGTVEELKTLHNDYWKLNEICKEYSAIGTVSEFRELKDKGKFIEWALNNGYREDLTIERIDVNGDYCPENCCWIPLKDQYKNKQSNHNKMPLPEAYKPEKGE